MILYCFCLFFFNATATTEIYTLSLHDALPISTRRSAKLFMSTQTQPIIKQSRRPGRSIRAFRSEEHTSELQSRGHLVCRLLLEKKKKQTTTLNSEYNCEPRILT